jgi:hypothetical protein
MSRSPDVLRAGSLHFAALSSEELAQVLIDHGAHLVARHEHGIFLAARRHLVFLRRAAVVSDVELFDVLRAAALAPTDLVELLRVRDGARAVATV